MCLSVEADPRLAKLDELQVDLLAMEDIKVSGVARIGVARCPRGWVGYMCMNVYKNINVCVCIYDENSW